jgi:monoamine oxidase
VSESPSVLIIGAGAAGLAAARYLHDAGVSVQVLEAQKRIGGRAYTDSTFANFPVELGAEFIHGDHAVTHDLVQQAGLNVIPVVRMGNLWWGEPAVHRDQLPSELRQTLEGLLEDYAKLPDADLPRDLSLADYLRQCGWNSDALRMADILLAQTCCASIETLSCYDLIGEAQADHAGHGEARIREGYNALFAWYSHDLPIMLNTPVSRIAWGGKSVTVTTHSGTVSAQKCIITMSVGVLQSGAVQFDPPLSEGKQNAIAALRMEPGTKLIYAFREPLWSDDLTFMAHDGVAARWWTPGYRRDGAAVIAAFITAERAQQIDAMDESAALALGLRELAAMLNLSHESVREACTNSMRVSWARNPYARGAYAHVPPGAVEARTALAASEQEILFFAGEATAYDTNPQTVHGALESGWRAAGECLNSLNA